MLITTGTAADMWPYSEKRMTLAYQIGNVVISHQQCLCLRGVVMTCHTRTSVYLMGDGAILYSMALDLSPSAIPFEI